MKEKDLRDGELYEYRYRYKSRRSTTIFYCVLALIVAAALGFRIYWTNTFGGVYVDGNSMYPTLHSGDELLMKYGGDAERGDVIVVDVRSYGDEYDFGNTQFLIKRLIAVEGDTVYCEDGEVYIRYAGTEEFVPLDEPYIPDGEIYSFGPYEVGTDEIFFLGDNRLNSKDSRYKEGLSHLDCLYKESDIYGIVPDWAIKYKEILKYIPGMRISYS
ncbi:MAG: signal peptidase I [Christensenellaceae bacterium]|jgi:signal peptidase I